METLSVRVGESSVSSGKDIVRGEISSVKGGKSSVESYQTGINRKQIELPSMAPGLYLVSVSGDGVNLIQYFMKD